MLSISQSVLLCTNKVHFPWSSLTICAMTACPIMVSLAPDLTLSLPRWGDKQVGEDVAGDERSAIMESGRVLLWVVRGMFMGRRNTRWRGGENVRGAFTWIICVSFGRSGRSLRFDDIFVIYLFSFYTYYKYSLANFIQFPTILVLQSTIFILFLCVCW